MKTIVRLLFLCVLALAFAPGADAHSGHTVWGGWTFDWEVKDGAGIAIRNVRFNNELVLYKASMPVIRVRYNNNQCGPYADRIFWDSLVKISNCGNNKVCQKSYSSGGRNWLEVGVYARIGSYHIYQVWYLSHDGWIQARMHSKGLQCQVTHQHHPYWRMDFDINGAGGDQIFEHNNNAPNTGWGPGWSKFTTEFNTTKNTATDRRWFTRDSPGGHGAWIIPSGADGTADSFSNKDAAGRTYKGSEDVAWAFGASGHLGYNNGEDIQEKDDVFWYVAHLHHEASGGGSVWHAAGPWIFVAR
jgi:hypothetical protein